MTKPLFSCWTNLKPVIGMVHLLPLPGSPKYDGDKDSVRSAALRDAEALVSGGVHGLILENLGDAPFYPDRVPAYTVAYMTALAVELRHQFQVPLGINVLRNDGCSALAVAHASEADFIRINIFTGARVTDQGIIQGMAHAVMRERAFLRAHHIKVLADINVKHSAPLGSSALVEEIDDVLQRGGADGIIVSGKATGKATDVQELRQAKAAAGNIPVFVGSGVSPDTLDALLPTADGFIVGTYFKREGRVTNPVDPARVKALLTRLSS